MRLIVAVLAAGATYAVMMPRRPVRLPVPAIRRVAVPVCVASVALAIGVPAIFAVTAALVGHVIPTAVGRARSARAGSVAREQWPDFLALVRSRIGSGSPLPDAVRTAARSLGGPFLALDQAWGGSFLDELDAARARWSDPVADRVLVTIRIAAKTGGAHVDSALSALATSLSGEMQIRAAHDAALTQQRLTAGVALVSPWIILVLSLATNPQASAAYANSTGHLILSGGAMATLLGYILARRAAMLAKPPRVFG